MLPACCSTYATGIISGLNSLLNETVQNISHMCNIEHFSARMELHHVPVKTSKLTLSQIFAIPCRTCGAAIGKVCQLYTGGLRNEPHRDRKLSAVEAAEMTFSKRQQQIGPQKSFAHGR
jgi:hypothetical protein